MKRVASVRILGVVHVTGVTAVMSVLFAPPAFAAHARRASTTQAPTVTTLTVTTQGPTSTTVQSTSTTQGSTSGTGQPSDPVCSPSRLTGSEQLVGSELSGRVSQLTDLASEIGNGANHLTPSDQQTLQTRIDDFELPGIRSLQSQVQQATTCAQLRTDAHSMVFTYRVYMVMTPQTHLTIAADDETYIESDLTGLEPRIGSALEKSMPGGERSAAEATYEELENELSQAQTLTGGLAAQILSQTPAGAPGNWQFFLQARSSLTDARIDLHAAYADALQIEADLS